ncbi:MAG: hypothetical protein K2P51_04420 [Rhabdochlamydiaceae bacterium]|nr:hypothetical protein [Rhabdochlamydiaceae bacterium]
MKKFLSTVLGIVVVAILAAVVVGFIFWSRVPDMVANNLSKKLNVAVTIDDMTLSWGKVGIEKVVVGNPPSAILSRAFSCRQIDVLAPFTRYIDKKIVIDEIDLNDVYLGLEFKSASGTDGNWTQIMSNLNRNMQAEAQGKGGSERSVLIRKLVLTNIDVDVVYRKEGGKVKKLPRINRIELTNVSSEGGLPMDQVMNSVLGQMLKSVFEKQNLKNMLNNFLDQPGSGVNKFIQPFKGLFNAEYQTKNEGTQSA